ncbi:MAG: hypothetical protein GQ529_00920 [Methyloprofundus sp.]|nr:hypothetical protein [Methyloprofundus sp.]
MKDAKKSHIKKAALMPYTLYEKLISKEHNRAAEEAIELDQFVGLLSDEFKTEDARYNAITK